MNDRELLELAAKAAGEPYFEHAPEGGLYLSNGEDWNPLENDGDALRLAVKLSIIVATYPEEILNTVEAIAFFDGNRRKEKHITEKLGDDPYAATRRAIVRAAAEIGKSLCDASIGRVK